MAVDSDGIPTPPEGVILSEASRCFIARCGVEGSAVCWPSHDSGTAIFHFVWKNLRLISGQNSLNVKLAESMMQLVNHLCPTFVQVR